MTLAEKLCVSRQAITKWETGKGVPDIDLDDYVKEGIWGTFGMVDRCTFRYR